MVCGPYFLAEKTVPGTLHLDMLQQCLFSQLQTGFHQQLLFQQDGTPSHYLNGVRPFLDEQFPRNLLG